MTRTALLLAAALVTGPRAHAQTSADTAAIRQTALDYIEGWYWRNGRWVIVNVLWENARRS